MIHSRRDQVSSRSLSLSRSAAFVLGCVIIQLVSAGLMFWVGLGTSTTTTTSILKPSAMVTAVCLTLQALSLLGTAWLGKANSTLRKLVKAAGGVAMLGSVAAGSVWVCAKLFHPQTEIEGHNDNGVEFASVGMWVVSMVMTVMVSTYLLIEQHKPQQQLQQQHQQSQREKESEYWDAPLAHPRAFQMPAHPARFSTALTLTNPDSEPTPLCHLHQAQHPYQQQQQQLFQHHNHLNSNATTATATSSLATLLNTSPPKSATSAATWSRTKGTHQFSVSSCSCSDLKEVGVGTGMGIKRPVFRAQHLSDTTLNWASPESEALASPYSKGSYPYLSQDQPLLGSMPPTDTNDSHQLHPKKPAALGHSTAAGRLPNTLKLMLQTRMRKLSASLLTPLTMMKTESHYTNTNNTTTTKSTTAGEGAEMDAAEKKTPNLDFDAWEVNADTLKDRLLISSLSNLELRAATRTPNSVSPSSRRTVNNGVNGLNASGGNYSPVSSTASSDIYNWSQPNFLNLNRQLNQAGFIREPIVTGAPLTPAQASSGLTPSALTVHAGQHHQKLTYLKQNKTKPLNHGKPCRPQISGIPFEGTNSDEEDLMPEHDHEYSYGGYAYGHGHGYGYSYDGYNDGGDEDDYPYLSGSEKDEDPEGGKHAFLGPMFQKVKSSNTSAPTTPVR